MVRLHPSSMSRSNRAASRMTRQSTAVPVGGSNSGSACAGAAGGGHSKRVLSLRRAARRGRADAHRFGCKSAARTVYFPGTRRRTRGTDEPWLRAVGHCVSGRETDLSRNVAKNSMEQTNVENPIEFPQKPTHPYRPPPRSAGERLGGPDQEDDVPSSDMSSKAPEQGPSSQRSESLSSGSNKQST